MPDQMAMYSWFRRTFPWWLRWIIYFIAIVGLFYGVEDLRGWYALKQAKQEYLASGRFLTIEEILGPAPADHENFGAVDFIKELYRTSGTVDVLPGMRELPILSSATLVPNKPGIHHPDILPKHFLAEQDTEDKTESEIAQKFLELLDPMSADLAKITGALRLPECRYPGTISYEFRHFHLSLFQRYRNICSTRAIANFTVGNIDEAIEDWISCDLCSHKMGHTLIMRSIGNAIRAVNLDVIWFFLSEGGMNREQLESLEKVLIDRPSALEEILKAVEVNTAIDMPFFELLNSERSKTIEFMGFSGIKLFPSSGVEWIDRFNDILVKNLVYLSPRGWFWQNQALYLRKSTHFLNGDPLSTIYTTTPYNLIVEEYGVIGGSIGRTTHKVDTMTQLAILAIRVERYHLKHGTYPDDLSPMSPPSDNYGYQIGTNGRPILYYDPAGKRSEPIDEDEFDQWKPSHLWRY